MVKKIVLGYTPISCPLELQYLGKEIAKNCKGLPLAVVGIAGVLVTMEKEKGFWQEVATHLSSYVSKDRDILELSYKHLPSHLKPCFLYLGMFKEDEEIPVRQLLLLWISQGFIPTIEDKILEDVAMYYLLELINRSMVQVAKTRSGKGVKTCTIHDLIRDMSLRLAHEENFLKVINMNFSRKFSIHEQHHHIHIQFGFDHFKSLQFGPHIRFLSGNFKDLFSITSSMMRLKVLKLSNPYKEYDGTSLELLVQLRHLECDGNLRNFGSHMKLEFLSVGESLDMDIRLNMPKLKHLQFGKYHRIPEAWYDSLPNGLQTLSRIIISDLNDEMRLRRFSHLRRLRCRYSENWYECPVIPDLRSLSQLVSLNVHGYLLHEFEFFNFPINIKKLSIRRMPITPKVLLSIGELHNLEILKMEELPFTEMRWDMSEDLFMKVKFLKLYDVAFKEWNISEGHFPSLEQLSIWNHRMCPLPFELGDILTLERIEVYKCDESVRSSARKIMEDQEAEGNEQLKVIISGVTN